MAITLNSKTLISLGNRMAYAADIAFDSSYPYGGEAIDCDQLFGIHTIDYLEIESKDGYSFEFDYTNKKIKAFLKAPLISYEEHHVLDSSYQFTTNFPAAFFMNMASVGQNLKFRSTGIAKASLTTGECCLASQMARGEKTTITVSPVDLLGGDGAFTGGSTNWTVSTDQWTAGSDAMAKDADGTGTIAHDTFAAVVGHTYRLIFTISSWSVGSVTATLGGTAGTARGADGTYTEDIVATTTDGIVFTPTNTSRFTLDSVTIVDLDVYASYVTQAWKEVWDNLVQDETLTLATGANTLSSGNKIAACMYIDQTTATAAGLTMIDEDDTAASGEVEVAFNAATSQFTVHSAQNGKAIKTTYIKVPDSGFLKERLVHNEGATKAGTDPYTNAFNYPILLWGYTGCMPCNGQATQVLIDYPSTPAAGEAVIDWFTKGARGGGAVTGTGTVIGLKSNLTGTGAYIWGAEREVPNQQLLEVSEGSNLSDLSSVKIFLIGA